MYTSLLVSFSLIGLGLSIPAPNKAVFARNTWPTSCKNYSSAFATFDDITSPPGVAATAIPAGYMSLLYQGFNSLNTVQTGVAPGIVPQSGNNYAISDARTTTTAGSAELTVNYAKSTVKAFAPKTFYYACALGAGQGAAAAPAACNIAITGFAQGDDTTSTYPVVSQFFSYNPSTMTGMQQMVQGTFKADFQNLQYILIQYSLPGGQAGANPDLVLVMDDVAYDYCS